MQSDLVIAWFLSHYLLVISQKKNLASAGLDRVWEVSQLRIGESLFQLVLAACLFSMEHMKLSTCIARMSVQNCLG